MKKLAVLVVALALFSAIPTMAAEKTVSIDGLALRDNVIALDHEWMGSGPLSTNLKLAIGKQSADDTDMALLGLAVGKRGYVHISEFPAAKLYAGGYLYGQTISASALEMPYQELPSVQSASEPVKFTERELSLGLVSELGLKLKATKNLSLEVGPVVTIPAIVNHTNSDGVNETQRFPYVAYGWRLGVGYTW